MKILAFTDVHASPLALEALSKAAKKADILVCTGDFTVFGKGMKKVMESFGKMKKDLILVHGNHEDEAEVSKEAKKYKNIHYIHKKSIIIKGFEFVGYGGGGFALVDKEFEDFIKPYAKKKNIILLTHGPPYGTKLDKLAFGYCGSKSLTKYIKTSQPLLLICGHIHENEGNVQKIGKSTIINPGQYGTILEL